MPHAKPSNHALDWHHIAGWLAAADIDFIEIDAPGMRLRMLRGPAGYRAEETDLDTAAAPTTAPAMAKTASARTPCAGVFLTAHPLRTEALAAAGRRVAAGDVVALVRIGQVLVPVTTPVPGTVLRTLAPPDSLVGYGTPLLDIDTGHT